ncbi:MAG: nucleoside-diphosphate kinase [Phycisphaerales bacterium]|nr:nucleoside-diphosphate kinase [Phycisphaerales bacterium]
MDRTLIILKPDCIHRNLIGRIISRFEDKGLKIIGLKMMVISHDLAHEHYAVHKGKPFYDGLIRFMTSGPVVVIALEGNNAITVSRDMMGATFGFKAQPGTIRGDFGVSSSFNLIHGSDSPEAARAELERFFSPKELLEYMPAAAGWVYDYSSGKPQ